MRAIADELHATGRVVLPSVGTLRTTVTQSARGYRLVSWMRLAPQMRARIKLPGKTYAPPKCPRDAKGRYVGIRPRNALAPQ
jgi:hypothetical protein